MAFEKVHHVKYSVSDLDRSVDFYRDLLGFKMVYEADRENLSSYDTIMNMSNVKLRIALMEHSPTAFTIALIEFQNPPAIAREIRNNYIGHSSLALQTEDAAAQYEMLTAAGVATMSPPVEIVRDGKPVSIAFYFLDPDGIPIEFWQPWEA